MVGTVGRVSGATVEPLDHWRCKTPDHQRQSHHIFYEARLSPRRQCKSVNPPPQPPGLVRTGRRCRPPRAGRRVSEVGCVLTSRRRARGVRTGLAWRWGLCVPAAGLTGLVRRWRRWPTRPRSVPPPVKPSTAGRCTAQIGSLLRPQARRPLQCSSMPPRCHQKSFCKLLKGCIWLNIWHECPKYGAIATIANVLRLLK